MVYNEPSLISQFVRDATADISSPTTSTFSNKVPVYREHVTALAESITKDEPELLQLKKACTEVHAAAIQIQNAQQSMVKALDSLGMSNTRRSAIINNEHQQMHMGTALLKFSILFKDMASLSGSFAQSLNNSLVFPLDELLRADIKDKTDLRKSVDKAYKEYENKYNKAEKEIKQQSKEAGWSRSAISASELADSLTKERTLLQHQMCAFFLSVHRVDDRKSVNLLQHFIDFYFCQQSLHQDAVKCLSEYNLYVQNLVTELDELKRARDLERTGLFELHSTLAASPHVIRATGVSPRVTNDHSGSAVSPQSRLSIGSSTSFRRSDVTSSQRPASANHSDQDTPSKVSINNTSMNVSAASSSLLQTTSDSFDGPAPTSMKGYLMKKSAGKLAKTWQKRAVELRDDKFYLYHSDDSLPAVEINLMTAQIKTNPDDRRCFDLYCFNRTYQFMAEDEIMAQRWMNALQHARELVQSAMFRASQCSEDDASPIVHDKSFNPDSLTGGGGSGVASASSSSQRRRAIDHIKSMVANSKCADCGADDGDGSDSQGVSWLSLNLGCLLCIKCSGCHRELGVHVSRIQSISLDKLSMSELLVPLILPNDLFNSVYEATLPSDAKLRSDASAAERRGFIQAKYVAKRYVHRFTNTDALVAAVHAESPTDILRYLASDLPLDVTVDMNKGDNALTYLIRNDALGNWLGLVELLLSNGFDPNLPTINREHALHICVENDRCEHIKLLLLSRRIDLSVCNTKEQTALQLAEQINPRGQCCKLLSLASTTNVSTSSTRHTLEHVHIPEHLLHPPPNISHKSPSSFRSSFLDHQRPTSSRPVDSTDMKFRHLSMLSSTRNSQTASSNGHSSITSPTEVNPYVPLPAPPKSVRHKGSDNTDAVTQMLELYGPAPDVPAIRPPPLPSKPRDTSLIIGANRHSKQMSDMAGIKQHDTRYTRSASENQETGLLDMRIPATHMPASNQVSTLPSASRIKHPTRSNSERPFPTAEMHPTLPMARRRGDASSSSNSSTEPPLRRCRALYDCQADNVDELNFRANEIIIVHNRRVPGEDDTWMFGHVESNPKRRGIFPVTFVSFEK